MNNSLDFSSKVALVTGAAAGGHSRRRAAVVLADVDKDGDVVAGDEKAYANVAKNVPISRAGRPEEIASVVLWLCSLERAMWLATPSPSMGGNCAMMKRKLLSVLLLTAAMAGAIALGSRAAHAADGSASAVRTPGKTSTMKIRIKLDNKTLTATLADNATSRDFVFLLPLTLTLKNYASTEKISYLPRKLSTEGAPAGCDPDVGDITYYAPWGNLAIFYKDFGYSDGLIKLGKIDGDAGALNTSAAVEATIEMVK